MKSEQVINARNAFFAIRWPAWTLIGNAFELTMFGFLGLSLANELPLTHASASRSISNSSTVRIVPWDR